MDWSKCKCDDGTALPKTKKGSHRKAGRGHGDHSGENKGLENHTTEVYNGKNKGKGNGTLQRIKMDHGRWKTTGSS